MLLYVSHVLVPQDEGNKERLPTNWMTVGVELLLKIKASRLHGVIFHTILIFTRKEQ
jgi:hypothetical protein